MLKNIIHILLLLAMPLNPLSAKERTSSYPYLAGDTWRFFCKHVLSLESDFAPQIVETGDTIFVEHDSLSLFEECYLPYIENKCILVTANSERGGDNPLPGNHAAILNSPKVYKWFIQNIHCEPSDQLIPIPIGLANTIWEHGDVSLLNIFVPIALSNDPKSRFILSYLNFAPSTHLSRMLCLEYFAKTHFSYISRPKSYAEYLDDLSKTVFVVSPRGGGLDCHRTWEALLMGCYPIVLSSTLDPLYKDLPVLIVNSWEEITEDFLKQKQVEFDLNEWSRDKLYAPYWFNLVKTYQEQLLSD